MILIFRIGPTYNPNWTDAKFTTRFLSGFSAEQVIPALEHMLAVTVRGPRPLDETMAWPRRLGMMESQTVS
jgi:hypothetical protein